MRKLFRRLIPFLFLMTFVNYLDRINIGYAQLQMGSQLKISSAVFGFAGSIFFLGYMVLQVPSNLMLQRVGARRWIARILFVWGVVSAATAFVSDGTSLSVMRLLLGLVEGGFLPGVAVYAALWFPRNYRGRAVSGYIIGTTVASVLGGPISATLMTYAGGSLGLKGWQWMFLVEGGAAIGLGILALRFMTERPADAAWLEPEERAWLETTLAAERAAAGDREHVSILRVVGDVRVWSLAFLFGCALVGVYGLALWLPQIVKSLGHLSTMQVGWLSAVPPLLGVFGTLAVGRNSDRTGDHKRHLAFVYGMSAVMIAASAYAPNKLSAYILLCLTGLFINAGNPVFWSLASSFRSGSAGAATIALVNTIAQFGGLVGPWVIGVVRGETGGFHWALITMAAFLTVSTVTALVMRVQGSGGTIDAMRLAEAELGEATA